MSTPAWCAELCTLVCRCVPADLLTITQFGHAVMTVAAPCAQVGLVFSIYSFASVAASPAFGRLVQLGYLTRRSLLLAGLLVVGSGPSISSLRRHAARLGLDGSYIMVPIVANTPVGCDAAQVCFSTALFGFVSEMKHEQWFLGCCLALRAIMGMISLLTPCVC